MKDNPDELGRTERIPLKTPDQQLGLITLNRPREMNPLNWATVKKLRLALGDLSNDNTVD